MASRKKNLLEKIDSPADLKHLSEEELIQLSAELREFIIDEVCKNPGHLGASLGVVELTIALHKAFNAPHDKIVWDVGHQAYGHKILTGRRDQFHTNRKYKGISGFPKMSESEYDAFGVGHSSTSISAALGMAVANHRFQNNKNHVVAVIGDGSLTGGMAFEGLNNAGTSKTNILVIVNDNNIAIDPNVGAMKEYLVDIATSKTYNKVKKDVWNLLGLMSKLGPNAQKYVQKLENGIKSIILRQSNLFESLNFRYFGPVDGHDVVHLSKIMEDLKEIEGPKLLHVLTKKGKGFKFAEQHQTKFHAPGKFDKITGELLAISSENKPPKFQDVFGHTVLELARTNEKIVGVTPAMLAGSSLNLMMDALPHRTFDVGIAEQHAVTFSAGMASQGLIPFCNIYSTFMQRAYDQVIHDVALQKLHVVFCLDRGGLVGDDGATHHGVFDLAFMRNIPNMIVGAPMDEVELRNMMFTAQEKPMGPFSIRYPRGNGVITKWRQPFTSLTPGKGRVIQEGNDMAILSIGSIGNQVKEVTRILNEENIDVAHYDMRWVKPLDEAMLDEIFRKFNKIITIEDGVIAGGFGSAIIEYMTENGYQAQVIRLGVPDRFIDHGTPEQLYKECGFDVASICNKARSMVKPRVYSNVG
ncbi:MAG: 1-deoxy-D-xylulose-5-phosphate synthase [Bacteroidota bacterium]